MKHYMEVLMHEFGSKGTALYVQYKNNVNQEQNITLKIKNQIS